MTVASRLYAALLKAGPAVTRDVNVRRDVVVRAPDGVGLLTDVYLARPVRPLPVILMRSPYGRGVLGTIARLFAERGYHAVIQSVRGTFGSGGRTTSTPRPPTGGPPLTGSSGSPGLTARSAPSAPAT